MRRELFLIVIVLILPFALSCDEDPLLDTSADRGPPGTPSVEITSPRADVLAFLPPYFSIEWAAQNASDVRWIIASTRRAGSSFESTLDYIEREAEDYQWSQWTAVASPDGSGTFSGPPLDFGDYVLVVQARNSAGEVTSSFQFGRDAIQIRVADVDAGPIVTLSSPFFGWVATTSRERPPLVLDFPSGVAFECCWSAEAATYGGVITGYRYSWGIEKPDGAWTPFMGPEACAQPRTFYFGTHTLVIEVKDDADAVTRIAIALNIVPMGVARNILLIDDWIEASDGWAATNGGLPSDAEHDAFWQDILLDVEGFDSAMDVLSLGSGYSLDLPLDRLANYKAVIWSAGESAGRIYPQLAHVIRFDPVGMPTDQPTPNVLAMYMAAGGRVLLAGDRLMTLVVDPFVFRSPVGFPLIFRYELGGDQDGEYPDPSDGAIGDESFAYRDCCLNVIDVAHVGNGEQLRTPGTHGCPVTSLRRNDLRTEGLRRCLPQEPSSIGDFPTLELRPEAATPGRAYHESRTGLNCDVYNPPYFAETACRDLTEYGRDCFEPIYGLGCLDENAAVFGAPVAFWTSVYAGRVPEGGGFSARSAVWGFQPVYFEPAQVKAALDVILFGEWMLPRTKAP